MIEIRPKDNTSEGFDKAMRTFKKVCQKDGFLREIRERRYFIKPSKIRHDKDVSIKRDLERKRSKGKSY